MGSKVNLGAPGGGKEDMQVFRNWCVFQGGYGSRLVRNQEKRTRKLRTDSTKKKKPKRKLEKGFAQ